jgi:hypothetical protein
VRVKDFKLPTFLTKVSAVYGIIDGTFGESVGSLSAFIGIVNFLHLIKEKELYEEDT